MVVHETLADHGLRRLPEDLGLARDPRQRADRAAAGRFTEVRRAALALAREVERRTEAGDLEVVEGGAPRRLRRLQPERPRPHRRLGLVGAPGRPTPASRPRSSGTRSPTSTRPSCASTPSRRGSPSAATPRRRSTTSTTRSTRCSSSPTATRPRASATRRGRRTSASRRASRSGCSRAGRRSGLVRPAAAWPQTNDQARRVQPLEVAVAGVEHEAVARSPSRRSTRPRPGGGCRARGAACRDQPAVMRRHPGVDGQRARSCARPSPACQPTGPLLVVGDQDPVVQVAEGEHRDRRLVRQLDRFAARDRDHNGRVEQPAGHPNGSSAASSRLARAPGRAGRRRPAARRARRGAVRAAGIRARHRSAPGRRPGGRGRSRAAAPPPPPVAAGPRVIAQLPLRYLCSHRATA